jgi:hypothetical protein
MASTRTATARTPASPTGPTWTATASLAPKTATITTPVAGPAPAKPVATASTRIATGRTWLVTRPTSTRTAPCRPRTATRVIPTCTPAPPRSAATTWTRTATAAPPTCRDVVDGDGDTYPLPGDCNDLDATVSPGSEERCNNVDDDCDGVVDEGNPRLFGDSPIPHEATCGRDEGACRMGPMVCAHREDGSVFDLCLGDMGSTEICDGFDNDCDGLTDVLNGGQALPDEGQTSCGPEIERGACRRGSFFCRNGSLSDCRGATMPTDEVCNGADDDCDGQTDIGPGGEPVFESCYGGPENTMGVGECRQGIRRCVEGQLAACDGEVQPAEETCDGLDNDCDNAVDDEISVPCWDFEAEKRGVGACRDGQRLCVDGTARGVRGPGAALAGDLRRPGQRLRPPGRFVQRALLQRRSEHDRRRPAVPRRSARVQQRCVHRLHGRGRAPARDLRQPGQRLRWRGPDDAFDLATDPLELRRLRLDLRRRARLLLARAGIWARFRTAARAAWRAGRGADHCAVLNGAVASAPAATARRVSAACGASAARASAGERGLRDGRAVLRRAVRGHLGRARRTVRRLRRRRLQCADLAQSCAHRECRCGDNAACQAGVTVCGQRNGQGDFLCQGCVENADCGPSERCCDRVCTPTNPDTQCAACGQACDPLRGDTCAPVDAGGGRDFACVCGAAGLPCDPGGPSPFCIGGACVACRDDADCGGAGAGQCVDHVCRACDPADSAGCGEQQLCCGLQCQATGPGAEQSCQACGASCEPGSTNTCAFRLCACGDGPPCSGATPVCDDALGVCIECLADADCANDPDGGQCVERVCRPCDPNGHEGCAGGELCCAGAGGGLRCEATGAGAGDQCESCDLACGARETSACAGRACGCGNQPPCAGGTPVCDDARGACVECLADADCAGRPGGGQCVANTCRPCDPADHAGCAGEQLCCNGQCTATGAGAGQSCEACGEACDGTADTCLGRDCECGATGAACAAGRLCVNGACPECVDNSQCGADELCCGNVCQPTGAGAGQSCQACGQACNAGNSDACDARACRCGDNPACGGATPLCDDARGTCVQCMADADCSNNGQCVANQCRTCDPADHAGCAANQLCCNFQCQATGPALNQQCQACGTACGQDATSACSNRQCLCGNGPACGGNARFCNDNAGMCVACRGDMDCGGNTPQCAGGACRACDPADDAGCGRRVCANDYRCRGCERDSDCDDNSNGNDCHNDGTCHR